MGCCCCSYRYQCRKDALRHSGFNMIVFGILLTIGGVCIEIFLRNSIFNFGHLVIWAGVAGFVTGIASLSIAATMGVTDEDWGIRGLVLLCLVAILCVAGAISVVSWKLYDAGYFQMYEDGMLDYMNETISYTGWFTGIVVYSAVDIAGLIILGSAVVVFAIACCCSESSDIVDDDFLVLAEK